MTLRDDQESVFDGIANASKDRVSLVTPASDLAEDDRICLTMLYFLPQELVRKITTEVLEPLMKADPEQHYIEPESYHVTVQGVRTISKPPKFTDADIEKLRGLDEFFRSSPQLEYDVEGIFKTSVQIGLRAYPTERTQDFIRALREKIKEIGVPDDKKYFSDVVIGNVTICRYLKEPNQAFLDVLETLKDKKYGRVTVDKVALVTCNASCHPKSKKTLHNFEVNI